MYSELREQAIKLRVDEEFSYSEIKKRLGVSKSTLSYWLRDFPLGDEKILELRRKGWSKGEASREKYRNTMRKRREVFKQELYLKNKNKLKNISIESYYIAGLMLYLGEGEKKSTSRIMISNTNPKLIMFFLKWMIYFLEIKKENMKIELHLYENMDINAEEKYWLKSLKADKNQLYKTQVRKLKPGSYSYRESYRHGTCNLIFHGVKKKLELMTAIEALMDLQIK